MKGILSAFPEPKRIPTKLMKEYFATGSNDFVVVASPNTNSYWIYWEGGNRFYYKDFKTTLEAIKEIASKISIYHPIDGWFNGKVIEL